jgi:hypothetical protein
MKERLNDTLVVLTGAALSGGSLMMAFYAGMQTDPAGRGPLILSAVMLTVGYAFCWSGVTALLAARKDAA